MHDLLSALTLHTYTKADLNRRIGLLRASLEAVLFEVPAPSSEKETKEAILEHASKDTQNEGDVRALEAWYEGVWKDVQGSTLPQLLAELEKASEALPHFELYVPAQLDDASLEALALWYRKEVVPNTMFVIHIKASVVGGCGFVAHDQYHEHSLRTRLASQKGLITKLINSYA